MQKIFFILLIAWESLFAQVAIIKNLTGSVKIKRVYDILPVEVGTHLKIGDILITDQDSSVGVIFNDGTRLSLGEKSHILIETYIFEPQNSNFSFELNMTKGKALFESGKFGVLAPSSVKFKVPEGTIGIRGTKFYVDIE